MTAVPPCGDVSSSDGMSLCGGAPPSVPVGGDSDVVVRSRFFGGRRWGRQLAHYPRRRARYGYLALVVVVTIVVYYQQYVGGAVSTSVLVRDFSAQSGRGRAMGLWTLGPVMGSLVVAEVSPNTLSHLPAWQDQFRIAGIAGLAVGAVALVALHELSPGLRDQLMVTTSERVLVEARARGRRALGPGRGAQAVHGGRWSGRRGHDCDLRHPSHPPRDHLRHPGRAGVAPVGLPGDGVRAPWMAAFTETVERRNPALVATGLAIWGWILRVVVVSFLILPTVVASVTPVADDGARVEAIVGRYGPEVATLEAIDPATRTALRDTPPSAAAVGTALHEIEARFHIVAAVAVRRLEAVRTMPVDDRNYLAAHSAQVVLARRQAPGQWLHWWWVCVAGEIVFLPTIWLLSGRWRPSTARRDAEEHRQMVDQEPARMAAGAGRAASTPGSTSVASEGSILQ